jgi:hypothetical protein
MGNASSRAFLLQLFLSGLACGQAAQDWTRYLRTAGHSLKLANVGTIVQSATETNVFGIEVDNDIPGRYESFLDPTEKLNALRAMALKAHEAGNFAFVYIAGTECITGDAASRKHSLAKDHPDWLQRKITGEPALFGGGSAFWVRKGDEDVWVTPFAKEWRKIYMERVRQIASTGIDGVYVDIPYWMTHFTGWEDSWASFDDYTVAAFRAKTGLNAKTDLKIGDYRDANFRKWIDFRIDALTSFMQEIDTNVKSINPKCKTIAEIYPGIDEAAVRVGSDVHDMYRVVDTIAHEYSSGGDAASRTPLAWFRDMATMYSFRAFAGTKPTWMLSYSWDNEKNILPSEAMKNLAMAQLTAGTNTWDAQGHVMSGSNDIQTRTQIFGWMKQYEAAFFQPRRPLNPIGVYFSPKSRDYFPKDFTNSYQGILLLLLQSHLEFQVVTPETLGSFHGQVLILPDARCLSKEELQSLIGYEKSGKRLVVTGETGKYDDTGALLASNPIHKFLGIENTAKKKVGRLGGTFIYLPSCPGKDYYDQLRKDFDRQAAVGVWKEAQFTKLGKAYTREILEGSGFEPAVEIRASPYISTQIASVDGKVSVFIANFKGLKAKQRARQILERDVKVTFHSGKQTTISFLPFMGHLQRLQGSWVNGRLTCSLPPIEKSAVVWLD